MSTEYQQAREALGGRLRELRISAAVGRLTGPQLAERLGWVHSKIYKLEGGRQTATSDDLRAWAEAVGRPEVTEELLARLRGFESHIRSRRRHRTTRDTDEAVRSRMERQAWLYRGGRVFHALVWEAALHALVCPPAVLVAQLDRLAGQVGMDTVELGVIPLGTSLKIPAANGFWILDERLVITEDRHAELWLDDAETVASYVRVWETLRESAAYGTEAQNVIARARRALHPRV
ncbi:Scr1 family TA system antitoxin-like transcriptional regulator [Streptomyces poriticola]|uniref:Scr1 family TA system antitoxin-like transcriptional regulator n=1 Tax=Streptomyces poriticola TaxID=3120506 RepID=UPI002FCE0FC3